MIVIRRLTLQDVADYRRIRLESLRESPDSFGTTYESARARPLSFFEGRLTEASVYGAYDGAAIVGTVCFSADTGPKDRHKGHLTAMYVAPAARRRGVGARLIEALIGDARDVVEQVLLSVVVGNTSAINLYERLGFTAYGVEPRALKAGDRYLDEVLMVKFLHAAPPSA
jgi:ribosomal protein S18 acetylase RimI-like enzyme